MGRRRRWEEEPTEAEVAESTEGSVEEKEEEEVADKAPESSGVEEMTCPDDCERCSCDCTCDFDFLNPSHYKDGGIEVIDVAVAKLTGDQLDGYCSGKVLEHMLRMNCEGFDRLAEQKKAKWYLDYIIAHKEANK